VPSLSDTGPSFQYALFNPGRGSIWYLTGMAMRQCIEYGYHHEVLQHSMNASPLEIDMKRRLFWTTYKVRLCVPLPRVLLPQS
jgi:hypothetical protein